MGQCALFMYCTLFVIVFRFGFTGSSYFSFFFGFRKVAARFMSSATFADHKPNATPLPTPLLIFIFSVFVSLLNGGQGEGVRERDRERG